MVTDLDKLTKALREDTPELLLAREIVKRRGELIGTLSAGGCFELRDVTGRRLVILVKKD